ncbi:MAG: hypothetical protein ACI9LM_001999 [Alteromonadaceae bacterium]|jgi:hypothetical protein
MQDIENMLKNELTDKSEENFTTSDDELIHRAIKTANNQQGGKDIVALGMASLWVVFVSIFIRLLKPFITTVKNNRKR